MKLPVDRQLWHMKEVARLYVDAQLDLVSFRGERAKSILYTYDLGRRLGFWTCIHIGLAFESREFKREVGFTMRRHIAARKKILSRGRAA